MDLQEVGWGGMNWIHLVKLFIQSNTTHIYSHWQHVSDLVNHLQNNT